MKTTLVTVVNGEIYEKMTEDLFRSADEFFHPTGKVEFLMLEGRPGWPDATMYRYHALRDHFPDSDYVFMSDADMLFEADVDGGILPTQGVTATLHPGYVNRTSLPFENRAGMWTFVSQEKHRRYYCGGFVGGKCDAMLELSELISKYIDHDVETGRVPVWHDESALNAVLAHNGWPEVALSPSFCYPNDDSYYKTFWTEPYKRVLVALDKTGEQRGDR